MENDEEQFVFYGHSCFEALTAPHSRQRARWDVINPHDGHIRCDRTPMICGFRWRIQRSNRIVRIRISRPIEMLVTLIQANLPGECRADLLYIEPTASILMSIQPSLKRHTDIRSRSKSRKIAANGAVGRSLAEKPKMGELQMDWLRSEDLKGEKSVTAPAFMIAG